MTNYCFVNGKKVFVSVEAERYSMENGLGETISVIEDYGNDVSFLISDYEIIRFEDATKAANVAFRKGFRE